MKNKRILQFRMSYYLHLYFFLIPIVNLVGVRINKDYREE